MSFGCTIPYETNCAPATRTSSRLTKVVTLTASPEGPHAQANRDIPQSTQSFRYYAAGGHVEADRRLAVLAERDIVEARGRQLDLEIHVACFSDSDGDDVCSHHVRRRTRKTRFVEKDV